QPFGGEGLSGTGPKAGGPHYLYRFATERTLSVDTTAAGGNASLLSLQEEGAGGMAVRLLLRGKFRQDRRIVRASERVPPREGEDHDATKAALRGARGASLGCRGRRRRGQGVEAGPHRHRGRLCAVELQRGGRQAQRLRDRSRPCLL